jgi:hypothetical protein
MLAELEQSLGIERIKLSAEPHSLEDINNFGFGEIYQIRYNNGKAIELKQLDTLLDCIRSEYRQTECWDIALRMAKSGKMIHAFPRNVMGRAWNRDIDKVCRKLESAVTHYNLTGQWPENMELS